MPEVEDPKELPRQLPAEHLLSHKRQQSPVGRQGWILGPDSLNELHKTCLSVWGMVPGSGRWEGASRQEGRGTGCPPSIFLRTKPLSIIRTEAKVMAFKTEQIKLLHLREVLSVPAWCAGHSEPRPQSKQCQGTGRLPRGLSSW